MALDDWIATGRPEPESRIPRIAQRYMALVPAADADDNDRAGLRLPDVAVPLGTHTGFNVYKAPAIAGEMCDRDGSYLPFGRRQDRRRPA